MLLKFYIFSVFLADFSPGLQDYTDNPVFSPTLGFYFF